MAKALSKKVCQKREDYEKDQSELKALREEKKAREDANKKTA